LSLTLGAKKLFGIEKDKQGSLGTYQRVNGRKGERQEETRREIEIDR
jgi:hypothetical protein